MALLKNGAVIKRVVWGNGPLFVLTVKTNNIEHLLSNGILHHFPICTAFFLQII